MRSTSGLIEYLHGVGPLYWKTQLQPVTATFTKEAEYYSAGLCLCSRVMIGFRQLCATLGFSQSSNEIQSDNQPALYSLKTRLSHSKSRHIKIQFHYVRDLVQDDEVHFNPANMVVNLFTKALPAAQFQNSTTIHTYIRIVIVIIHTTIYAYMQIVILIIDATINNLLGVKISVD